MDVAALKTWVGRTETLTDMITPVPVIGMSATLDRDDAPPAPGDVLPLLWHWLFFAAIARQSQLGPDGHPKRGGFLPPVPLPRRMWAGGRLTFHRPLRMGETITRVSTIGDINLKQGRTGALAFVLVRHVISGPDGLAISEEHDIVYRDPPRADEAPAPGRPAPAAALWQREIVPDDVFLFRYSALTFNGHRIHYDRRYVTEVEGYPGLIVHGPLIATLLMDLIRRNTDRPVTGFRFRATRPLFDHAPFHVCGDPGADGRVSLWARDADGFVTMDSEADLG